MTTLKDRFNISADELESRMENQEKHHDEPIRKAVAVLEMALDTVLEKLGVNFELGNIQLQQEALGIIITEEIRPEFASINGFFVSVVKDNDIVPYSWIGDAKLNSMGEVSCEIQYFIDDRLEVIGGGKII